MRLLNLEKILKGTPENPWNPKDIRTLRKGLDATQEQFARILGVVASTVHRWEKGDVSPDRDAAARLDRLKEVTATLDKYFQAKGRVAFFTSPDGRLDGDRPMDLLAIPSGVKRIKTFIRAVRAGDFA
ncbi:MAG TPA: helix-turn-helix domain-containing protein [Planctomycetota bacterium]|nr:helix-turn-helix domain-containing protein [Planctomycetota bacterium]